MYEMADAQGCINTYLPQHVTRKRILDFTTLGTGLARTGTN